MEYQLDKIELSAGTLLFAESDSGDAAYLVQSGEIEIFVTRDGSDVSLARRGPGSMVGEMAVIVQGKRSASARVTTDCALLVVTKSQIDERMANIDPIVRLCLDVVIDRYLQSLSMLERLNGARPTARAQPVSMPHFQAAIGALSSEADLRRGLHEGELELFFQPIVRLSTLRLTGFEGLARWRHPKRGMVPPSEFIPIAESSGFIVEITDWCLQQAISAIPRFLEAGSRNIHEIESLTLSINVSGRDLVETPFDQRIGEVLSASSVPPECLKIEVTESTLLRDPAVAARRLEACRNLGVRIAIDDFGTGYSSLSYLNNLPVSAIKIAPPFVQSMGVDATTLRIIQLILRLSDQLGLPVVAEGIEHQSEARALEDMGCALGQGYLFGRPASLEQTLTLIRNWRAEDHAPSTPLAEVS
jgi:EAL domain-containing protein (putative c-di-GMP-specific phosphodiesterase class I)